MTTPTDRIYKSFKKLNILDLVYEKSAKPIRYVITIMAILSIFFYFKDFNALSIAVLIIFGVSFVIFYVYTNNKFDKKFCDQFEEDINIKRDGLI